MITRTEYNALIHSIWQYDQRIAELFLNGEPDPKEEKILRRDREALSGLLNRLSMPAHLQPKKRA